MLDGPLSQQAYSVLDSIFSAEAELIELVAAKLDQVMPEVLSRYLATGDPGGLGSVVNCMLTLEGTRASLMA